MSAPGPTRNLASTIKGLQERQLQLNKRAIELRKKGRAMLDEADALSKQAGAVDAAITSLRRASGLADDEMPSPAANVDESGQTKHEKIGAAKRMRTAMRLFQLLQGKGEVRASEVAERYGTTIGTIQKVAEDYPDKLRIRKEPQRVRGGFTCYVEYIGDQPKPPETGTAEVSS